jgi:protein gp37
MGDREVSTGIEWTDETWNPIRARLRSDPSVVGWHCEHASPGCEHCYSESRNLSGRCNLGTKLPFKPGHRKDVEVFLDENALTKPLHWRKPRMIFVCSMTDLFADFVTDEMLNRVFAVMALCPQHTFQVLTKRSARMREYLADPYGALAGRVFPAWVKLAVDRWGVGFAAPRIEFPLPNVWLGVSVEDRARMEERAGNLKATPAAVRWWSAEPLIGDLGEVPAELMPDWIVCGGESGPRSRPMHPDWARSLRDQCAAAGVPYFFKQWGAWCATGKHNRQTYIGGPEGAGNYKFKTTWIENAPKAGRLLVALVGKKRAGRLLDGALHDGMPAHV